MVQRIGAPTPILAFPIGLARDPRQRRVEVLWVKACGGDVFIDPEGRRFAAFPEDAAPPRAHLCQQSVRIVGGVPCEWVKLA